jgi:hypothetical protein
MSTTVSYLDRFLDPMTESLTPELARTIAGLRVDPELQAQIDKLRQRANEGMVTPEEEAEYKDLVEAIEIIAILQSKARRFLAAQRG